MDAPDDLLAALNDRLAPLEAEVVARFAAPRWPVVFLAGAPRSGHTLLSQLLARSAAFGYVDNLVARFWLAPVVATRLERAVGLDGPSELRARPPTSRHGRTSGWAEPHEFGHFLRRWISLDDSDRAPSQRIAPESESEWRREVAGLEHVHARPIFFRNLVYGANAALVARVFPGCLFVVCRRRVAYQAQSILEARAAQPGGTAAWWSLRPAGWERLRDGPPEDQVVGQIAATHVQLDADLARAGAARIDVEYGHLCADPRGVVGRIAGWLRERGATVEPDPDGLPARLDAADRPRLPQERWERLLARAHAVFPRSAVS